MLWACKNLKDHKGVVCISDICKTPNCNHMKLSYLFGGIVGPILFGSIWFGVALYTLNNIIQITIAPRVYLIERVNELVRK